MDEGAIVAVDPEGGAADRRGARVVVSEFNSSVDRFFEVGDAVASICGEEPTPMVDEGDVRRLSSMATFLTEWKYFKYEPKNVTFALEGEAINMTEATFSGVCLPQFSSASPPKNEVLADKSENLNCKDFVMHAGGSVWALDWCPRAHQASDCYANCEYLAVAAHPPGSSYNQIGLPLTGRGLVQIWCILNVNKEVTSSSACNSPFQKKSVNNSEPRNRGRPRKHPPKKQSVQSDGRKRGRGRPRKTMVVTKKPNRDSFILSLTYDESALRPGTDDLLENESFASPSATKVADRAKKGKKRQKTNPLITDSFTNADVIGENAGIADISGERMPGSLKCSKIRPTRNPLVTNSLRSTNSLTPEVCNRMGEEALVSLTTSQREMAGDSSDLDESYRTSNGVSGTKKSKGRGSLEFEGLAEDCTEMLPLQWKEGNRRTRRDLTMMESIDSSSAMTSKFGTNSLNSLGRDVPVSHDISAPFKKAINDATLRLEADSIPLGKHSDDSNVDTRMPQRHKGRRRKQSLEAKSFDTPPHKKSSLASSSCQLASNFQVGNELLLSPIKNLPNGDTPDGPGLICEAEEGFDPCTSEDKHASPIQKCTKKSRNKVKGISSRSRYQTEVQNSEQLHPVCVEFCGTLPMQKWQNSKENSQRKTAKVISSKDRCQVEVQNLEQLHPVCVEFCGMPIRDKANGDMRAFNKVTSGALHTDNEILEQDRVESRTDSCEIKVGATKCAPKRRLKKYARGFSKNNIQPKLPDVSEEMPSCNLVNHCVDLHASEDLGGHEVPLKIDKSDSILHKDIALPRVVLCLAHMGSVAWDVKWRPPHNLQCDYRMGYLAALLGNGSLEVWEVPQPCMVKALYTSCKKEGTDPRFLRLKPVFRCSKLKCGDKQSIPIVVEWSPSSPCDLLLAGCHDGTVALWKFSATDSSPDTKPLLCFNADSLPIRSISWAPNESDTESSNLIVTAAGDGLKFWDLRDPYLPLWDYTHLQRHILSVDWLSDPRWIVLSYDDGFLRILNLCKAASDAPVTGKPSGSSKTGIHSIPCSAFAIWSVQVSRAAGLIAYCGVDGRTNYFQLQKSVLERSSKNRALQFSCGSLLEEDQNLVIKIPVPNSSLDHSSAKVPLNTKKSDDFRPIQIVKDIDTTSICEDPKGKAAKGKEDNSKGTEQLTCFVGEEDSHGGPYARHAGPREVFPAKSVAMHRVRWNMNCGSERWLCYGGAAGIIRCQEIS